MGKDNVYGLIKRLNKATRKKSKHNTKLVNDVYEFGEQLMVDTFKQMPLDKQERMRFKFNKVIKETKEYIRVAKAKESDNLKSKDGQTSDNGFIV